MNKLALIVLALICVIGFTACAGNNNAISVESASDNAADVQENEAVAKAGGADEVLSTADVEQQTAAPDADITEESPLKAVYGEMEASGFMPEMMELPQNMVLDLFGFDSTYFSDAVFYLSYDNMLADEVILVIANDEASADYIEEMLGARLDTKAEEAQEYSPEQYAIITECSVYRNGNTVALIVGPEAEDLTSIFIEHTESL